jgi:hypothetical protein
LSSKLRNLGKLGKPELETGAKQQLVAAED